MQHNPDDVLQVAEMLRTFLLQAGWTVRHQARNAAWYLPPASLGFLDDFSVAVPIDARRDGSASLVHATAAILADLYGYRNVGDLVSAAIAAASGGATLCFSARFVDRRTQRGSMPLCSLTSYAANVQRVLEHSALFRLGAADRSMRRRVREFARDCRFLQTEEGSFVVKVEIPNLTLKHGDLFDSVELGTPAVCATMFAGLQFLGERLPGDDDEREAPSMMEEAAALFDERLLQSLKSLLLSTGMDSIEFALRAGTSLKTTGTGVLTRQRRERIADFCRVAVTSIREGEQVDVTGFIVEERSKNPEGHDNHIVLMAENGMLEVRTTLSQDDYGRAGKAHHNKLEVRLRGRGTRYKTHLHVTQVEDFAIVEHAA